ncbi:MAG: ATP-binding cassette domain-containing protein [Arenicellales bacterium WSBS_2016_MAG_OTU3]
MAIAVLENVEISFGSLPLLQHANLTIQPGERIGIVGRNGAGKSTLLKLLAGEILPDDGRVRIDKNTKIATLTQSFANDIKGSTLEVALEVAAKVANADAGRLEVQTRKALNKLGLIAEDCFENLSGGMQRRVLLAGAVAAEPELLLLDEPTNHLDITSIEWLEGFARAFNGALCLVTHDRRFLQTVCNRIVDIDLGQLTDWSCGLNDYIKRKQDMLDAAAERQHKFAKKLSQEEGWIREGISARRKRNQGRVRRLLQMREQARQRRRAVGNVKADIAVAEKSGKKVIELADVSYSIDGKRIINNFSASIQRGDRIAMFGPNGAGKTTLLQLMLKTLTPDSGAVEHGTKLKLAYFDQHRSQLNENQSAMDNVAGGREFLEINGKQKHAISYMQDFLFTPARARAPIHALSGGERARLLLARLFAAPSNLLIMDEPTNDLDIETLELLEELLLDYQDTLLLVSHDREFIDRVATGVIVFENDSPSDSPSDNTNTINEYVGGYTDWLRQRPQKKIGQAAAHKRPPKKMGQTAATEQEKSTKKKLSYKFQRELDALPGLIDRLEKEIESLTAKMAGRDFYQQSADEIADAKADLAKKQGELEQAYKRWGELEQTS